MRARSLLAVLLNTNVVHLECECGIVECECGIVECECGTPSIAKCDSCQSGKLPALLTALLDVDCVHVALFLSARGRLCLMSYNYLSL